MRRGRSMPAAGFSRDLVKTANNRAWRKEAMRAFLLYQRDLRIIIAFVPNAKF
jgi:hypothetical protein